MTGKHMRKTGRISQRTLTDLLRGAAVVMLPLTVTAVLSMLRLLTADTVRSDGWDVCCLVLTAMALLWAVICIKTRLLGKPMPNTGLVLSGMLLLSVPAFVLAYAMEKEIFGFHAGLWALGRLFGSPAAVSADGMEVILSGVPEGSAAMLAGGLYLLISLAAAVPVRGKSKK